MKQYLSRTLRAAAMALVLGLAGLVHSGQAAAQESCTPLNATGVGGAIFDSTTGNWILPSIDFASSSLRFAPPSGTTFAELDELSAIFQTDDGLGGGSPRYEIALLTPMGFRNLHIYFGTPPNFQDPGGATPRNTGNLIAAPDTRYDLSQFLGYYYVGTYTEALQLLGNFPVVSIRLVVDAGWFFADDEQTVIIINYHVCVGEGGGGPQDDDDGDGVPNGQDPCPNSDTRPMVDVNGSYPGTTSVPNRFVQRGCTIQDLVNHCRLNTRSHGSYVSCIVQLANQLRKAGVVTQGQRQQMVTGAAQSFIGKKKSPPASTASAR